jgi:hypothetical protein
MVDNEDSIEERVAGRANDWRRSQQGVYFVVRLSASRFSKLNARYHQIEILAILMIVA